MAYVLQVIVVTRWFSNRPVRSLGVATVLVLAAACSASDSSDSSDEVRNITLPSTTIAAQALAPSATTAPPLVVRSLGDGRAMVGRPQPKGPIPNLVEEVIKQRVSAAELDAAMRRALRGLVFTARPDPIPDIRWQQLDQITAIAGAAPVIARLPVAFDAYQTGKALRANAKSDAAVWGKATFARGSNDPAIARAALALEGALTRQATYTQRTSDLGLMYSAVASVVDGGDKASASGALVRGVDAFAQLGAVPFVRLLVTRVEAEQLFQRGLIAGFAFDRFQPYDLDETTEIIAADRFQAPTATTQWSPPLVAGVNGSGATIAVLDSGVAQDHPALSGAFGDGACYVECDAGATALDPVEVLSAASPCSLSVDPGCDHGTHVAGIAAGRAVTLADGTRSPGGVAPGARVAAYRVCATEDTVSPSGCLDTAAIQALGRVATRATSDNIVAANMSFGWPNRYDVCPTDVTTWNNPAAAAAAGVAFAAGVQLVKSNGNGGRFRWAECETSMLVVANATKGDSPSSSTDFHPNRTTLYAPGEFVFAASVNDSGVANVESKSGTSMAAPHVAGAIAVLDQAVRQYNQSVPAGDRVTVPEVLRGWLGIHPADAGRVMISDDRSGTDSAGNTSSGGDVPRLSLRNLWSLLTGRSLRARLATPPSYTAPMNRALVAETPTTWTVTPEANRREFIGATALPLRRSLGFSSWTGWVTPPLDNFPTTITGRSWIDGPYLVAYSRNARVQRARSLAAGTPLTVQLLAYGPQPCVAGGWVESARIPLTNALINEGVQVEMSGVDAETLWQIEGVLLRRVSGFLPEVAVDYRPVVFGDTATFPEPVNLNPDPSRFGNWETLITWFDLDRVTGDVLMLDDAGNGALFPGLRRARTVNDAVEQTFHTVSQESPTNFSLNNVLRPGVGVIGWQEVEGVHDCAVAMSHVWMGR